MRLSYFSGNDQAHVLIFRASVKSVTWSALLCDVFQCQLRSSLRCSEAQSLKYKLIQMPDEIELIKGEAERVGIKSWDKSVITHSALGRKRKIEAPLSDHSAA